MPVLVATRTVRIGRKEYKPGDSFEASDKDAKTWIAIRKARLSDAGPPAAVNLPKEVMSRAPAKTKVETAEPVEEKADEPADEPAPKRHYRRRDMSADQD